MCPFCVNTTDWCKAEEIHTYPKEIKYQLQRRFVVVKDYTLIHTRRVYTATHENFMMCEDEPHHPIGTPYSYMKKM